MRSPRWLCNRLPRGPRTRPRLAYTAAGLLRGFPFPVPRGPFRFGNIGPHLHLSHTPNDCIAVIAPVGDDFLHPFGVHFRRLLSRYLGPRHPCCDHRRFHGFGVGRRSPVRGHRHDGSRLHVHRVLYLEGQRCTPVHESRDLRLRIAGAYPILVGHLLGALPVHPPQCRRIVALHTLGCRQSLQIIGVAFPRVSPHDWSRKPRRVDRLTTFIRGCIQQIDLDRRMVKVTDRELLYDADRGACVHVLDIDPANAQNTVDRITASGGQAAGYFCDAADESAVADVVKKIADDGRIHILVNSVGMAHVGTLESTSPQDFDRIFRVNVRSYYNSMRATIGHMKANGGGVILNIASIAASAGLKDRFAYSMSKGAVVAMTYSVAKDYLEYKIRCNCISPARVHTPFVDGFLHQNYPGREREGFDVLARSQPIGRMAQPREIAALALFLCSEEASFITGCDYPIDGGFFNLRG